MTSLGLPMGSEDTLTYFSRYIERELGIVYAEHNYFQLLNRLEEITKLLGVESVAKLYELAQKGVTGAFRQLLLDLATNNETSFFRDPKIFKAIESSILPKFIETILPVRFFQFGLPLALAARKPFQHPSYLENG